MSQIVGTYGLGIVFLVVALEAAGLPLPGETTLIAAAALAAKGDLNIVSVALVGGGSALVGDNIGYWLGRVGGRRLIARWARLARLAERVLPPSERFFARHGAKAVVLARFLPLLRVTGAWMAGISRMPWWRFLLWNAIGSFAWAASVSAVTFYAGQAAIDAVARYGLYGAAAVVVLVLGALAVAHVLKRRLVVATAEPPPPVPAQALHAIVRRGASALARPIVVVSGCCLAAFVSLTAAVAESGGPSWDRPFMHQTHSLATPSLDTAMLLVADLGSSRAAAPLALTVVATLLLRRRYRAAILVALVVSGGALSPLIKALVERPRPHLWPRLESVHSFSFPSGHALTSMLLVAALCGLAWQTRWRWPAAAAGAVFVAAVGFSRVYLGVHYPSDVLASWSLAVVWIAASRFTVSRLSRARSLAR